MARRDSSSSDLKELAESSSYFFEEGTATTFHVMNEQVAGGADICNSRRKSHLTDCIKNNNRIGCEATSENHVVGANRSKISKSRSISRITMANVNVITRIHLSLLILLFITLTGGVRGVHINDLRVPAVIRNGTEEFVILDCDFHIEEKEKSGLVVKWFFNKMPAYQWIPNGNSRGQDLGILRGKLNLDYKADSDTCKMYRALKIIHPTVELSGEWSCRVSTFEGEAYKVATMIIFAPEKVIDMKVVETKKPGFVNISCWAFGVFPEPKLTIYHGQNKDQKVEDMVFRTRFNKGAYDVSAYKVIEDANLSSISSVFDCELTIPNTHYLARKSTLYEPGSMALQDGRSMGSGGSSVMKGKSLLISSHSHLLLLPLLTSLFAISQFTINLMSHSNNAFTSSLSL